MSKPERVLVAYLAFLALSIVVALAVESIVYKEAIENGSFVEGGKWFLDVGDGESFGILSVKVVEDGIQVRKLNRDGSSSVVKLGKRHKIEEVESEPRLQVKELNLTGTKLNLFKYHVLYLTKEMIESLDK